jgi:hypothetical protein
MRTLAVGIACCLALLSLAACSGAGDEPVTAPEVVPPAAAPTAPEEDADRQAIRLVTPFTVGDAGRLEVRLRESFVRAMRTRSSPPVTRDRGRELLMEAAVRIDEVSARGYPQRRTLRIAQFTEQPAGGEPRDLLPAGTQIRWPDDAPDLPEEVQEGLRAVLDDEPAADAMHEPEGPLAEGERVAIDPTLLEAGLAASHLPVGRTRQGSTVYRGRSEIGGHECHRVEVDVEVDGVDSIELPEDARLSRGTLERHGVRCVAVDGGPVLLHRTETEMTLAATIPARAGRFALTSRTMREARWTPRGAGDAEEGAPAEGGSDPEEAEADPEAPSAD